MDRGVGRLRGDGERGAAAVEFALIVPILLLLVFGMVQYSFYFWAKQGGADVARHAARLSAVGKPAECSAFTAEVTGRITELRASTGGVSVSRTYADATGAPVSDVQVGDIVTVTVEFNSQDLKLPLIPFIDDGRVSESAEARVENVPAPAETC